MSQHPYYLTSEQAARCADLALGCIRREFPCNPGHVIADAGDLRRPRELHPAFYGCFDWHSAVHGHWLLVHVLRRFPDLPAAAAMRAALAENLTVANLRGEADYFAAVGHRGFERPYGWAWLLKLAEELAAWDDPDGRRWSAGLGPLADLIVARYQEFLPKQTYPIRTGVHANTAFGLAFAFDYARAVGHTALRELIVRRSLEYYAADRNYPAAWEPGGNDFLSPCLVEADLMRRILPREEFAAWLEDFLPGLRSAEPANLLQPAIVTDRSDGQIVHLDGLNLSRAWCMWNIVAVLPPDDPRRQILIAAAGRHADAGLVGVAGGDYMGEHWLATFAVYMLECAGAYS